MLQRLLLQRLHDLLAPEDDWGPALAVHRAEQYPLQIPEARKAIKTDGTHIILTNVTCYRWVLRWISG